MVNMLKVAIDDTNEPKAPLHIIEAGDCWTYMTAVEEYIRYEEAALNTTTDDEVREMLEDAKRLCKKHVKRLSAFMQNEGIPLPDVTSAKPKSDCNDIPLGVKLTDDEIVNGIMAKLIVGLTMSTKGQADAIRDDVGKMWLEFYLEWSTFGGTLKTLAKKRGWLKVPPYYYPPGSPV
nr:DUF3231 family protein [Bacillus pinisoli]